MKTCAISVQDIDGRWHQLAAGTMRGVWPESIELVSDEWGPKTATFELHRDPDVAWPDLGAYAPMEATVGGRLRWTGRIVDAPTRSADQVINVQAEGWQSHLDDDQYERKYVHTRLADWKDMRSLLTADLTKYVTAPQVQAGDGALKLSVDGSVALPANGRAGVVLDLGPGSAAKRLVLTYEGSANSTNLALGIHGADGLYRAFGVGFGSDYLQNMGTLTALGASGTFPYTLTTARRYVAIVMDTAAHTPAAEAWFKVTSAQVFTDTAYESGDASVLRGDHVVLDALDQATILLSGDLSRVEQTTDFSVPEFAADGPRTPRQACESVNVFFDHALRVDEQRRMVFRERSSVPDVKVGKWGGSEFDDASNASGADVVSKAIARGDDPAGTPVSVTRAQAEQPDALNATIPTTDVAFTNPSFDTNTTGWAASNSYITRDTTAGRFDSSPAAGRWDNDGAGYPLDTWDALITTMTGTFRKGKTYVIKARVKRNAVGGDRGVRVEVHAADGVESPSAEWLITTAYDDYALVWTPAADHAADFMRFTAYGGDNYLLIDTLAVFECRPTIIDKRGFRKAHTLDSGFSLTARSAQRLADTYLAAHRTTPFRGKGQATGHGAIRDYATGQAVSPDTLLVLTGGLMHFDHLIDPDTGVLGRDGRLVRAAYRPETDTVAFDIDSSRGDFDRTLQRAGVLVGQLR